MIPVMLNTERLKVAVAGGGECALRRMRLLKANGAVVAAIFAPEPLPALVVEAGHSLIRRWPVRQDLAPYDVLFVADVKAELAADIAAEARAVKTLVNTEDQPEACVFHMPAITRRGSLVIAVSTEGQAPGLAQRIARTFDSRFGPEWAARVEELGALRRDLRAQGQGGQILSSAICHYVDEQGWLS